MSICVQNESAGRGINPLLNYKISDETKLKAFTDNKLNVARMMIALFDKVENTVGKEENAGYLHFSPFPTVFSRVLSFKVI